MGSGGATNRPVVAIIDDEVDITRSLRLALEDHGYQAVTTNDASEAMELLEKSSPSLILLDLLMPRMSGLSLYRRIASHPALTGTPIAILSGLNARADLPALFAREGGTLPLPAAFIDKPVDIEEILLTIEELTRTTGKELPS